MLGDVGQPDAIGCRRGELRRQPRTAQLRVGSVDLAAFEPDGHRLIGLGRPHVGRSTGELRADVSAEDIAASLIGIFTVAHPPEQSARASRLLNILMDGLRPTRA